MKFSKAGPILWVLSIQYFITQVVVGLAYPGSYSVRFNTISDLGNTVCGAYRSTVVCSSQHLWMNISFILLGITMIAGSALIGRAARTSWASTLGFIFMALSGVGSMLVGLFPENTVSGLHVFGAGLVFLLGNLALILFGYTLQMPRWLRYYTVLSGAIGLIALARFLLHGYLGLGIGGMERVTAYPQTIWMIVYGGYILMSRRLVQSQKLH